MYGGPVVASSTTNYHSRQTRHAHDDSSFFRQNIDTFTVGDNYGSDRDFILGSETSGLASSVPRQYQETGNYTDYEDNESRRSSVSRRSEPVHQYSSSQYNNKSARTYNPGKRNYTGDYRSKSLPRTRNVSRNDLFDEYLRFQDSSSGNRYQDELPLNGRRYRDETGLSGNRTLPSYLYTNGPETNRSNIDPADNYSEAVVEEERSNPDGTTSIIRRVVTATTNAYIENEVPKVEVHISPATETIISPPPLQIPPQKISPLFSPEGPLLDSTHIDQSFISNTKNTDFRAEYLDTRHEIHAHRGNHLNKHGVDFPSSEYFVPPVLHSTEDYGSRQTSLVDDFDENRREFRSVQHSATTHTTSATTRQQQEQHLVEKQQQVLQQQQDQLAIQQSQLQKQQQQLDMQQQQLLIQQQQQELREQQEEMEQRQLFQQQQQQLREQQEKEQLLKLQQKNEQLLKQQQEYKRQQQLQQQQQLKSTSVESKQPGRFITEQKIQAKHTGVVEMSSVSTFYKENDAYTVAATGKRVSFDTTDAKRSGTENDVSLLDILMYLKTTDTVLKANAAGYLMHLSFNDDDIKRRIGELDIIPPLVKLLDHEDEHCHRNAAGALKNLSHGCFVNDNKRAIYRCGGIEACVRLLQKTSRINVREHVTGILCNLSSYDDLKLNILRTAVQIISILVIIPLSGWEKEQAEIGIKPGVITWSVLLRNSTGVLRNLSSAGYEARQKIRSIEGLVDAFMWIIRAAVSSDDRNIIDHKVVENIICCLRNISYKIDSEIDHTLYPDAIRVPVKPISTERWSRSPRESKRANERSNPSPREARRTNESEESSSSSSKTNANTGDSSRIKSTPDDAIDTGCLGMKKKPFKKRVENRRNSLQPNKKPPPEEWKYVPPDEENAEDSSYSGTSSDKKKSNNGSNRSSRNASRRRIETIGLQLLWQSETVTIYIYLITNSTNPVTLEASAAAIHNLCGGKWNWSALLRAHIRLQKGIPPMHDLLSVDQEYVVRAIAYALRNLSIDQTNKWSIGRFAHNGLLHALPPIQTYETEKSPSENTICAVLSVLQMVVYKDYWNAKYLKDNDGVSRLVGLTREPSKERKGPRPLRTYSRRVVVEANRVLLYMWEFKECREAIKQEFWSHSKAEEYEKAFKSRVEKNSKNNGDSIAEMDSVEGGEHTIPERDLRRFIADSEPKEKASAEKYELDDFGCGDVPLDEIKEGDPLIRSSFSSKDEKNKKTNGKSSSETKSDKKHSSKKSEESRLLNDDDDNVVHSEV